MQSATPQQRADHWNRQGMAHMEQEQFEAAAACFRQVVSCLPTHAVGHANLGAALASAGALEEALSSFRRAVKLKPDYFKAYLDLGSTLSELGRLDEAVDCYRAILGFQPGSGEVHCFLGAALLALGDFEHGWPEIEWRWRCPTGPRRTFAQPAWDGTPLAGRTILLHGERGLGDAVQFIRYAALVKERGGRVLVECPQALLNLFGSCRGIDQRVPQGAPLPPFDVHAPLLSLPRIFGTRLETIPTPVPYLTAPAEKVERWRAELGPSPSLKVGLCWQGDPTHPLDAERSVALEHFAALAAIPGVQLSSLQVGAGAEQVQRVAFPLTDLARRFDPQSLDDAVAVITGLDLVISIDSALAHLAGALAVPVWVLLPAPPEWRWLLERQDSPWYPTMRLFRQREPGAWDRVFEQLEQALARKAAEKSAACR